MDCDEAILASTSYLDGELTVWRRWRDHHAPRRLPARARRASTSRSSCARSIASKCRDEVPPELEAPHRRGDRRDRRRHPRRPRRLGRARPGGPDASARSTDGGSAALYSDVDPEREEARSVKIVRLAAFASRVAGDVLARRAAPAPRPARGRPTSKSGSTGSAPLLVLGCARLHRCPAARLLRPGASDRSTAAARSRRTVDPATDGRPPPPGSRRLGARGARRPPHSPGGSRSPASYLDASLRTDFAGGHRARPSSLVADFTGLRAPGARRAAVLDRGAVDRRQRRVDAAPARAAHRRASASAIGRSPSPRSAGRIAGTEMGVLLGFIAQRVLGQYDLLVPDDPTPSAGRGRRRVLRRPQHPRSREALRVPRRATSGSGSRSTR